jgi:hypothetical protein
LIDKENDNTIIAGARRGFLKRSTIALGTAAVGDFKGIGSAEQVSGPKTLSGDELKEEIDPHVIGKLYPGRSEQQKVRLAERIVQDAVSSLKCGEERSPYL